MSDECNRDELCEAIDRIDNLLVAGDFAACDAILENSDPSAFSDALIVSYLGITIGARSRLKKRHDFYEGALRAVASRIGEDEALSLIGKYK